MRFYYFLNQIRYLLSTDQRFDDGGIGAISGIKYKEDYEAYIKFLYDAKENKHKWYNQLLERWDDEAFINCKKANVKKTGRSTTASSENVIDDREVEIAQGLATLDNSDDSAKDSENGDDIPNPLTAANNPLDVNVDVPDLDPLHISYVDNPPASMPRPHLQDNTTHKERESSINSNQASVSSTNVSTQISLALCSQN